MKIMSIYCNALCSYHSKHFFSKYGRWLTSHRQLIYNDKWNEGKLNFFTDVQMYLLDKEKILHQYQPTSCHVAMHFLIKGEVVVGWMIIKTIQNSCPVIKWLIITNQLYEIEMFEKCSELNKYFSFVAY